MTARDFALIELDARPLPGWRRSLAHRARPEAPADPRDRALAEQIINGVVKNLLLLQHLIEHYSSRSLRRIDPLVQMILAVALYQLRFLQRIPPSAAVDEAVRQTRRFRRAKASGFVNAVLRSAIRMGEPPLPSAEEDPERHAAIVLSHPPELFRRFKMLLGDEDALRLCHHNNAEPPTLVRLFRGVTPEQLQLEEIHLIPHQQPGMLVVQGAKKPHLAGWAQRGLAQAQDATSALVVEECDIHPGQTLMDRCAGLGTKTIQMHEWLGDTGVIVAIDPNGPRCEALRRLLSVRGIGNVIVHEADMLDRVADQLPRPFDRILADVPCSNSGVLPRRAEARYAQRERNLKSLAGLQAQILDDSAGWVARGGLFIYSTCSIWPEENERQVASFLQRHPDYELLRQRTTLPSLDADPARYHDGGYTAVLRRR